MAAARKQPVQLVTYAEIVERTGIPHGTLRVWRTRGKLPKEDFVVGQSPAWLPETIEPWIQANKQTEGKTHEE